MVMRTFERLDCYLLGLKSRRYNAKRAIAIKQVLKTHGNQQCEPETQGDWKRYSQDTGGKYSNHIDFPFRLHLQPPYHTRRNSHQPHIEGSIDRGIGA